MLLLSFSLRFMIHDDGILKLLPEICLRSCELNVCLVRLLTLLSIINLANNKLFTSVSVGSGRNSLYSKYSIGVKRNDNFTAVTPQ